MRGSLDDEAKRLPSKNEKKHEQQQIAAKNSEALGAWFVWPIPVKAEEEPQYHKEPKDHSGRHDAPPFKSDIRAKEESRGSTKANRRRRQEPVPNQRNAATSATHPGEARSTESRVWCRSLLIPSSRNRRICSRDGGRLTKWAASTDTRKPK